MPKLATNGVDLEYESYGDVTDPAVILIAGLGEQMGGVEFPEEFAIGLSRYALRAVRFDNRDVGLSTHLDGDRAAAYTLLDMADDVAGLIRGTANGPAHVVGASMGGVIGRWVALRHPDLVASLTIVMSGAGAAFGSAAASSLSQPAPHALERMLAKTEPAPNAGAAIDGYVDTWRSYNGSAFPFDEQWVRWCAQHTYLRSYDPAGVRRQLRASIDADDLLEAQSMISCPTTIIHGEQDPIMGVDHAIEVRDRVRGAELEVIEGMGHEMPREVWPRLFRVIDAVRQRAGPS